MFIHSTSGLVTEQDMAPPSPEEPSEMKTPGQEHSLSEEDPAHPHNHTSTKSVSMDLTLEPGSSTLDPTSKCEEEVYVEQVGTGDYVCT